MSSYSDLSQMAFNISTNQESFLKQVDHVCKTLRPYEEECYLQEKFNDKIIPAFAKIGMLGCPISRKYGGLGYDTLTYILALERIGREGSSMRTFFSVHISLAQMTLQRWGTEEQKKEYLSKTTNGDSVMAFALTEPGAGSDPSSMTTKFESTDSDHYILNGKKHWIGNGTFADLMLVFAKEDTKDNNDNGKISAFIIDRNSCPGLRIQEMKNKMGLLTVKNAEIDFENCIVPKKNLLGPKGKGLSVAYSSLIDGRLSVAAGALGVMQDCLKESIVYSKGREQHGSVLAKKQLIQEHIAMMTANIESSKWLNYRAAVSVQKLHSYVEHIKATDDWQSKLNNTNKEYSLLKKEADRLASIAKFHATNTAFDTSNRAVQIFGASGYRKTTRVARHFLDSRAITIYEGTNEILELKIASMMLGRDYTAYR